MFKKKRNTIIEIAGQMILLMSAAIAIIHGMELSPPDMVYITKMAPVGLLAVFVLINIRTFDHGLLLLGLIISSFADLIIDLPGPDAFINGLKAFLLVQIIYLVLFLKNHMRAEEISPVRLRMAAYLWALAILNIFMFYPKIEDLMGSIILYSFTLAAMATAALISKYSFRLVGIGAILFVISDALLGMRQFLDAPEYTGYIIWTTYYLAQLMITTGVMLGPISMQEQRYRFDY